MAIYYHCTVQRIVLVMIENGMKRATAAEIKRALASAAKQSPIKQYKRTKAF